jgi:hypothetical protein
MDVARARIGRAADAVKEWPPPDADSARELAATLPALEKGSATGSRRELVAEHHVVAACPLVVGWRLGRTGTDGGSGIRDKGVRDDFGGGGRTLDRCGDHGGLLRRRHFVFL